MRKHYHSDKTLTIIVIALVFYGLVVLSSAGVVDAQDKFGSSQYYLIHQTLYGLIPGILLYFFLSRMYYKLWKRASVLILLASIGLLVMVLMPQFGLEIKGAQRWLELGIFSFQPSEFLKLALIIYFAAWFSKRHDRMRNWSHSAAPFFVIVGFISLLLILQPDIGTLSIIIAIALVMYFSAGARLSHILAIFLILTILFGFLIYQEPYRLERVLSFLDPSQDAQGGAYHINQALLGIGRGGIFGVGFGQSLQKINFLPEPVGDSIFVILAEELGLVGAGFLLFLFLLLAFKMIFIAKNSPDHFSQLFVIGVTTWIIGQAFMNIAAISGLIPLTGIPLPFISFGGSSLAAILAALGIVNNISKHSHHRFR